MTSEKFKSEVETLKKFYELYCKDKHENLVENVVNLEYKDIKLNTNLYLCKECFEAINYSFERLKACPHDIKPRCRNCSNPCYEKAQWKACAKVMKYSTIKLSLSKLKSKIIKIFD